MEYPSLKDPEKNIKKFEATAKTLPVHLVLYTDFEVFLVPSEQNKERELRTQRYGNCTSLADSPAFASPRYRNVTAKYSRAAEKTR